MIRGNKAVRLTWRIFFSFLFLKKEAEIKIVNSVVIKMN